MRHQKVWKVDFGGATVDFTINYEEEQQAVGSTEKKILKSSLDNCLWRSTVGATVP